MVEFLRQVVVETWSVFEEAAIFLLIGFVLAGALAVVVPPEALRRRLGKGRVSSVLWASALGAPLPLCSCGVLPTALALRRQGATDGATVAFLVATPETGIDSIALSYSLTDPVLTVARPIAGVLSAIAAGLATNLLGPIFRGRATRVRGDPIAEADCCALADPGGVAHHHNCNAAGHSHGHGEFSADACAYNQIPNIAHPPRRFDARMIGVGRRVLRYAFRDLLDDTSHWLLLGFVLSGIIASALPADGLERVLGGGVGSMLAMVLFAIPVYTCASSSTPVAATLVLKGLSPGAALVFLLTGPATNIGSLVVLLRFLGGRVVAIYLAATIAMAVAAGLLVDAIYRRWAIDPQVTFGNGGEFVPQTLKLAGAVTFLALLLQSLRRAPLPEEWRWLSQRIGAITGVRLTARRSVGLALAATMLLYAVSGLFQVQLGEVGLVFRFGRPVATDLPPGLHARLPWPIETHRIVALDQVRRIVFGIRPEAPSDSALHTPPRQSAMFGTAPPLASGGVMFRKDSRPAETFFLTGDGNMIDLRFAVQWRVADAKSFALNVGVAAEPLVQGLALAALREVTAMSGIDAIYTTARAVLERQVAKAVQTALDRYGSGIAVLSVRLLYDHPPDEVHDSFRDVASAQEDKQRTINRAETFSIEKINQSRGDAAAMLEEARGFKQERILRARGDAAAFRARLEAHEEAPELALFRLRLEAAEAVLPGTRKLITPGADTAGALDLWLNQPFATVGKR